MSRMQGEYVRTACMMSACGSSGVSDTESTWCNSAVSRHLPHAICRVHHRGRSLSVENDHARVSLDLSSGYCA
jgi:hypothetical protein